MSPSDYRDPFMSRVLNRVNRGLNRNWFRPLLLALILCLVLLISLQIYLVYSESWNLDSARKLILTSTGVISCLMGLLIWNWRSEFKDFQLLLLDIQRVASHSFCQSASPASGKTPNPRQALDQIERALSQAAFDRELVTSLLDLIDEAMILGDMSGRIKMINAKALSMLGYQPEEILGESVERIIGDGRDPVERIIKEIPKRDKCFWYHKDGKSIPVVCSASLLRDAHGNPSWIILLGADNREREKAENEIRNAKEEVEIANKRLLEINKHLEEATLFAREMAAEAQKANIAKSEFLAMISHEIRTPLNGILGFSQLLLDDPTLKGEQREFVSTIYSSGTALLSLINDLLDFSKIEAGRMELESIEFDLVSVIESVGEILRTKAAEKGVELMCYVDPEVPSNLRGDPGRLRQMLLNLANNAIKFTEEGDVVVRAKLIHETEEEAKIRFEVRDTGIGIPKDKIPTIFDKFTQVESRIGQKQTGTGLGLAIVKRFVEMMNGEIGVESEVGKGSTFHFTISFPRVKKSSQPIQEDVSLEGIPVLIVDDNSMTRRLLTEMTSAWGMKPHAVSNGYDAIQCLVEAHKRHKPYRMAIVDARMPGFDGFQLAEQIRQRREFDDLVILMLTSAGKAGDGAKCRSLGISAYLMKPVRKNDLHEAIMLSIGKKRGEESSDTLITQHSLRENRRKLRVLVVEDSAVNRKLVTKLLEKRGHIVLQATSGKEAISIYESKPVDVILMDVSLPDTDGFEITQKIREMERRKDRHTPIIAMTAHAMKGDEEHCLEAGMDGYIAKPIKAGELLETVETVFRIGREQSKDGLSGKTHDSVMDWSFAIKHLEGDVELLKEMAGVFLEQSEMLMERIRDALDRGDMVAVERTAHTIKGSVSNFAAKKVFRAAEQLEEIGRKGDVSRAIEAYRILEQEIQRLRPSLVALGSESK